MSPIRREKAQIQEVKQPKRSSQKLVDLTQLRSARNQLKKVNKIASNQTETDKDGSPQYSNQETATFYANMSINP